MALYKQFLRRIIVIQRFKLADMQILYNCQIQRKNRSLENEHHHQLSNHLSRSNNIHQNELRFKLKQKMRKDLSALSSELAHLSPEIQKNTLNQAENDKYSLNKLNDQHYRINSHARPPNQKGKLWAKNINYQHQYALNIPVQIILQDEAHEDGGFNDTGQIMDHKFDRILELNYANQDMNILEIESKFTVIKSYNSIKQPQLFEPDIKPQQGNNVHQKLLEEENHYIREQLIQFTQIIEKNKHCIEEIRHKYRKIKRQNSKLTDGMNKLNEINKFFEKQLIDKEAAISNLAIKLQEKELTISKIIKQKQLWENRIEKLQKNCLQYEQKLEHYELNKENEIEIIQQQKLKLKYYFQDVLSEKQKELVGLNEYINQLKSSQHHFQDDTPKKYHQDNIVQSSRSFDEEPSKIFQNGTNSICLSLAEAQSLKNIIQEKQQLHKAEILKLKQSFFEKELQYKNTLQNIQKKLSQIQNNNSALAHDNLSNKQIIEYLQNLISNFSECSQSLQNVQQWNSGAPQELLKLGYSRRIKKLEKHIFDARQEKMELISRINELEQQCLTGQKEQDEQLQQLLENCVNQLEKQRELNYILRNENEYFKQLICKQQMVAKNMASCVYN